MDEQRFDVMSNKFRDYSARTFEALQKRLEHAGRPPAGNALEAVIENMRADYGEENVRAFLQRCGELGIIT